MFRKPKTTKERRKWFDSLDQGFVPRLKRSPVNIPNAWDDVYNSRIKNNNWKEIRRTKYIQGNKNICLYCKYSYKDEYIKNRCTCRKNLYFENCEYIYFSDMYFSDSCNFFEKRTSNKRYQTLELEIVETETN